ncbi:MAG: NHLP bacteriocin system secretion protein [Deltaproteobacteria bacterium]|nr:NHLP bacteriocin system secretion protein [Deltaproteobacteria bacterium]
MAEPNEGIFRKESLEKLSSPEQLDQLMTIASSKAWLVLVSMGALLTVAVGWGLFGSVETKVQGSGIIIKSEGVLDVVAVGSGQLTGLFVDVGAEVQKGQIVGRIAQPDLGQRIEKSKDRLGELVRHQESTAALESEDTTLRAASIGQARGTLTAQIRADESQLKYLETKLASQMKLEAQGIVTSAVVQQTRQEMEGVRRSIQGAREQLTRLSVTTIETKGQKEREEFGEQAQIRELEREISLLEEQLDQTSRIVSSHSGRVLEIRARVGDIVGPGRPVLSLEPAGTEGTGLEALMYVPLAQGKVITPGMRAQISPDSVRREEHGVLVAIVTRVADFPSTQDGMQRVLGNPLLVQNFLQNVGQAPIEVHAELVPDARTTTGYRWTSKKGPPIQLGPGTPCKTTITTKSKRPLELVIPAVKRWLGG